MAGHAVINLGNSIIGVSILAIPFCFKECGLLLGGLLLLLGSSLNKQSCHLLLRASKATRRNSYELLAYHTLGGFGKLAVELSIICLLMSCCVAYFIIMGDLGPAIVSKWFQLENDGRLRAGFLIFLAMFFILPLSQRRNLESISSISVISIVFYMLFTADLIFDCLPTLIAGDWIDAVSYWKPSGVLRGVSIFSAAFSCQTVLFAVYETLQERTVKLMEDVVNRAITFVCSVYMSVGFFGYVLYNGGQGPKGDILLNFQPGFMSEVLRLGFAFSVALSFPLVIFPCRASIYTLFFSSSHSLENPHGGSSGGSEYIPPGKFRFITFLIVLSTLCLGITIPNVEVMLGFTGATMGNLICFVFPSLICLRLSGVPGRNTAKLLLVIGVFLMTASTYDNIQKAMGSSSGVQEYADKQVHHDDNQLYEDMAVLEAKHGLQGGIGMVEKNLEESKKVIDALDHQPIREKDRKEKEELRVKSKERHEPVIPDPPEEVKKVKSGGKDAHVVKEGEKEGKERGKNSQEKAEEEGVKKKEEEKEKKQDDKDKRKENLKEEADEGVGDVVEVEKRQDDILLDKDEKMNKKEDLQNVDEKRHKKEAKEIQKQSKKIKELEEMQQKQAEVIENQANALEFLLQKQKQDELQAAIQQQQQVAVGEQQQAVQQQQQVLQQQGVIQPQQGIAQAQQQPVIQPQQQQPVIQPQQQQPVIQPQQQAIGQQPLVQQGVAQEQQPVLQQQQQVLQQQQQVMVQQPIVQQQQPIIQQQPVVQQQPMVQQQQAMVQQQQAMVQQQQQPLVQQQAVVQQQPMIQQQPVVQQQQQQPMLQQEAVIQQQQPVLQQQQQQQQGFVNQQPVFQQAGVAVQQQLPVVDQGGLPLQHVGGFQQGVGLQPGVKQADMVVQGVLPQVQQNVVQNAQEQLWQDPQQQMVQQQQVVGAGLQNLAGVQAAGQQQPVQVQDQQFVQQQPQMGGMGMQNVAAIQPAAQQPQLAIQQQGQEPLVKDLAQPPADEVKIEVKRDVENLNLNENKNFAVDQVGLEGLPKELNVENRDIQGFAGNKRVLQSHGYEGDEENEEDGVEGQDDGAEEGKVGAGAVEEEREEDQKQVEEEEDLKEVDANKGLADKDDDLSTAGEEENEKLSNASQDKDKDTKRKEVEIEKKHKFNRDILAVDEKKTTKKKKTDLDE